MIIVNTHQAKTQLSSLLHQIETQHETVRICRNGKPIADLVPVSYSTNALEKHLQVCDVQIHYDPTAPLTEDEWPEDAK